MQVTEYDLWSLRREIEDLSYEIINLREKIQEIEIVFNERISQLEEKVQELESRLEVVG